MIVLLLASLITMVSGIWLSLVAYRKYRTAECPRIPSFNYRNWKPVWKQRSYFTPKGFRLHLIGTLLISGGCLLAFITSFMK